MFRMIGFGGDSSFASTGSRHFFHNHHEGWEGQLLDIGNPLCTLIVDVAAICTDDGSNADVRAFLTAAEVTLPEKFLTES